MANKEEQIGAGQVIHAETFRDSVATIEQTGSRKWVYPKKPKGKFTNYIILSEDISERKKM